MIELRNIYKSFSGKHVLRGVNLTIEAGETMVIIGRSGEGKSVLLKHLINLMEPDRGEIYFNGQAILSASEKEKEIYRRHFGMLFQGSALFDSLDVAENVYFGLRRIKELSNKELFQIAKEKLALVGLKDIEALSPSELSGGMKKRVALARVIAMNPSVILYDEPTTGIDPIMADAINDLIISLQEKLKVTSVVVTHDMTSAYKVADRMAMLHEGKIIEVGSAAAFKRSTNPYIKQFVKGSAKGPIHLV